MAYTECRIQLVNLRFFFIFCIDYTFNCIGDSFFRVLSIDEDKQYLFLQ